MKDNEKINTYQKSLGELKVITEVVTYRGMPLNVAIQLMVGFKIDTEQRIFTDIGFYLPIQ